MHRTAVFVDAGYLFAAGSRLICGERLPRSQLSLEHDAVLKLLGDLASDMTGAPLLRIYWYDGTAAGPTPQQLALAYRPNVKLRLGFVNPQGEQKCVDSLVITDLISLARNRAMADALLLTGDDDIRVGVQQAQEFGVRVHLLGIAPARENQSGFLVQEADTVRELTLSEVKSFLTRIPAAEAPTPLPLDSAAAIAEPVSVEEIAQRIAAGLDSEDRAAVLKESVRGSVPLQIDRRLLVALSQANGGAPLTPEQKHGARAALLDALRTRPKP